MKYNIPFWPLGGRSTEIDICSDFYVIASFMNFIAVAISDQNLVLWISEDATSGVRLQQRRIFAIGHNVTSRKTIANGEIKLAIGVAKISQSLQTIPVDRATENGGQALVRIQKEFIKATLASYL